MPVHLQYRVITVYVAPWRIKTYNPFQFSKSLLVETELAFLVSFESILWLVTISLCPKQADWAHPGLKIRSTGCDLCL